MIFFLIPVFSSNFPRKSVTTFFSFRNLSARSLMDEKMSSRPMVLGPVLDLDPNQVFNQVLSRPSITFSEHTKGSEEDDLRLWETRHTLILLQQQAALMRSRGRGRGRSQKVGGGTEVMQRRNL